MDLQAKQSDTVRLCLKEKESFGFGPQARLEQCKDDGISEETE